jgi:hypothetical protein
LVLLGLLWRLWLSVWLLRLDLGSCEGGEVKFVWLIENVIMSLITINLPRFIVPSATFHPQTAPSAEPH